ncbi:MAG: monovalent cation/H+ antiporter subunit D family protein [bacterium]
MTNSPFPILIIIFPLLSALIIPLIGLWKKELCFYVAVLALILSTLSTVAVANTVLSTGPVHYYLGNWEPPWGIEYVLDHLNIFIALIVSFISLAAAVFSREAVKKDFPYKTAFFYCTFLLLVTGLLGIVVTGDLFNLYVFLEIASLAGYALIAIGDEKAPLASFRYVIMGTVGACFYLLGVGYLYMATGSLNIADLSTILPKLYSSKVILVAAAFFIAGVALKMALFPLHVWLPDAYTYAPSTVSALIAPLMTKVGAYVMIRIMFTLFEPYFSITLFPITKIFGWIAVAAIIYGSIMALAQKDFKRILCYVIVAEMGYIAIGIGTGNRIGLTGSILHIANDVLMMTCLFFVAGAIIHKTGAKNIDDFRFLHKKMPFTAAVLVIGSFSVVGIPPLCGFFSKWYLILGAINSRNWIFAGVLLLSTLLNAIIFIRILEKAYFNQGGTSAGAHEPAQDEITVSEAPLSMLVPMSVIASGIILAGLFSGKIVETFIQFAIPAGL